MSEPNSVMSLVMLWPIPAAYMVFVIWVIVDHWFNHRQQKWDKGT